MAMPDFQTLMLPLMQIAADDKEHWFKDAVDTVARQFGLTEEELRFWYPSKNVRQHFLNSWLFNC